MTISISLKNVRKSYSDGSIFDWVRRKSRANFALDGINVDIEEGHTVGIIGENGAGKSTLLKIIAGLMDPTSGTVDIHGHVHAALTLGVGIQEELTGRENLKIDAELQTSNATDVSRLDEMVEFAELGEFIDRPVRTYSSGMKSRLSFTGLVFVEPEILLIDETLSAGDQWFQKKARVAINALCARGKIVVVVSHNLETILDMCNRCIWLRDGKVAADGAPADVVPLYADYQKARREATIVKEQQRARPDWQDTSALITNISVFQAEDSCGSLAAGRAAKILIGLCPKVSLHSPTIRINIMRPDGLLIATNESVYSDSKFLVAGSYEIEGAIDSVILSPGIYFMHVELIEDGYLRDSKSISVKVTGAGTPTGGKPVLMPAVEVCSVRVTH